jgi:hypothetical protein
MLNVTITPNATVMAKAQSFIIFRVLDFIVVAFVDYCGDVWLNGAVRWLV